MRPHAAQHDDAAAPVARIGEEQITAAGEGCKAPARPGLAQTFGVE